MTYRQGAIPALEAVQTDAFEDGRVGKRVQRIVAVSRTGSAVEANSLFLLARIFAIAMAAAIVVALAMAHVASGQVGATAAHTRVVSAALVNVHFTQISLETYEKRNN